MTNIYIQVNRSDLDTFIRKKIDSLQIAKSLFFIKNQANYASSM